MLTMFILAVLGIIALGAFVAETGATQMATWDTAAGSTPKAPGLLMAGGGRTTVDPSQAVIGLGNQGSYVAGMVKPGVDLVLGVTSDTKALIQNAARTLGALAALKIDHGSGALNWLLTGAVLAKLNLSASTESFVTARCSFLGTAETRTPSAMSIVALGSDVLPWTGSSITVGGAAYQIEQWEWELDNQCEAHSSCDSKSALSKRYPEGITVGVEKVSLKVSCRAEIAAFVYADTPAANIASVIVYTLGANTLTLSGSNLTYNGVFGPRHSEGVNLYTYELVGKPGSLVIT